MRSVRLRLTLCADALCFSTVATYQTLLRAPRLQKFDPAGLMAVIVDEAHHAAAPSYRHILSHFNSSIKSPRAVEGVEDENVDSVVAPTTNRSVPIIGFSATFSRHDGLALGSVFDRIVYHRDFLEMIKDQWLCTRSRPGLIRTDMGCGIGYAMCGSPVSGQT